MAKKYNMDKVQPMDLKTLTDLFGEEKQVSVEEKIVERSAGVQQIEIDKIIDYNNHHFRKIREWDEFVESIRLYGVLQPVILRPHPERETYYELIAGHNRKNGAKEAGLETLPAVVVEYDDIDTSVLVGVTNKQREETTDLEWGKTYRVTYELLKIGAGRPKKNYGHGDHNFSGKTTLEILAEKYGESAKTIQRKIRLSYLEGELANMYLDKKFNQKVGIELSYLVPDEMEHVAGVAFAEQIKITEELAKKLREESERRQTADEEPLDIDGVYDIMKAFATTKKPKVEASSKYAIPDTYFPDSVKKKDKAAYVLKALQYVQENGVELK